MQTIEIDFEVYKALTVRRKYESVSYNDVLREVLNLPTVGKSAVVEKQLVTNEGDWITKGVRFPAGTDFRALYKGVTHTGKVEKSALFINGKSYDSASSAAVAITGNSVNGWNFWEARLPNQTSWKNISSFRKVSRA
jgi:hypothetical protein